ncbi:TIGR02530 family flagellar biosynthesis protein [Paenibacillus sp. y28]|uniref:TIGR02530 family flagellar biosynthesis protein n=1 Tax=Paenibacillus sp. y28 TaxID=3129110 RepID=UPI003018A6B4
MTDRLTAARLFPAAIAAGHRTTHDQVAPGNDAKSFKQVLNEQVLKLSHHAEQRLQQRGIEIKPEQMAKIQNAVEKAASKGAKDSLVIMNGMALIVSVKNKTIVTAMDSTAMKDNVFTQIDSAVIVS